MNNLENNRQDPPDSNPVGSKDPREYGNNGNPARVDVDPIENYPEIMPDSLSKNERDEPRVSRGSREDRREENERQGEARYF